jgi:hypothetical protein
MLFFPILMASLWCAIVVELDLESARDDGHALVLLGRVLAVPPPSVTILLLCAVSASAVLAMAIAVSYGRGRRLERRMAEELADRWAELAEREVAEKARQGLLSWRIGELHSLVDKLLAERPARSARPLVFVPEAHDGNGSGATSAPAPARSRH